MQLYGYFRSSAAYRVRIALNLKGLGIEQISVHLQKEGGLNRKPEYHAINPQMRVPALKLDSGELIVQSLAIIEYLDEIHPQPPLLPRASNSRLPIRKRSRCSGATSSGPSSTESPSAWKSCSRLSVPSRSASAE